MELDPVLPGTGPDQQLAHKTDRFCPPIPQADVECDLHLEVPLGFEFEGSRKTHCLKLVRNLYGSKAARVWRQHLFNGLDELGFVQSGNDECVFYHGTTTFMIYTDDGIFCGPDEAKIAVCLEDLSSKFDITDEGDHTHVLQGQFWLDRM